MKKNKVNVWLVNTGWTGGGYGTGSRIHLPYTRAMIRAALTGTLDKVKFAQDPYFGLWVPDACVDVPSEILSPLNTWSDKSAYEKAATALIYRFVKNFEQYAKDIPAAVTQAGPKR